MSTNKRALNVGWKLATLNAGVASIRYRALLPLLALREHGVISKVFASSSVRSLAGIDVLVIVKGFTVDDVALAHAAIEKGIPVIYDLCDNVFVEDYGVGNTTPPADIVRQMGMIATAFVTPTDVLAETLHSQLRDGLPIYVVPDGIETAVIAAAAAGEICRANEAVRHRPLIERFWDFYDRVRGLVELLRADGIAHGLAIFFRHRLNLILNWGLTLASRIRARTVQLFGVSAATLPSGHTVQQGDSIATMAPRQASPGAKRLLWFGNHGGAYAHFGMVDIVDNRSALEQIARELDVELVVVSNHAEKFQQLIAPLAIPSRYIEWSPVRLQEELARADVVLIPNSCDAFSRGKSANRSVLALMAGRPVVATMTPALIPLRDCIETESFYEGIRAYLTDPQRAAAHLAIAQERCERLYGQGSIAGAWLAVLDAVRSRADAAQQAQPELILVANLVSDVEFIRPLAKAAKEHGVSAAIWISTAMIRRWPYTLTAMAQSGLPLRILVETKGGPLIPRFSASVRAVLTVADTNLGPHRFSNSVTQAANKAGIVTGTLQHGFENVGLTYSDDLHAIERIEFAAKHIFVWGDLSLLHPRINGKTRRKCIPAGCPKTVAIEAAVLPPIVPSGKPIVGVFENLHWHRYGDTYRDFFLESVTRLAAAYPDVTFIVKPHNAGLWLTTRSNGELVPPANLLIADPSTSQWEGVAAADLLPHLSGVITSPSTVAIDAARAGVPVAVVEHTLVLDNYAPLYRIRNGAQWAEFVDGLFAFERRQMLLDAGQAFVKRVLLPGDAAKRIIERLLNPASSI